MTESADNEVTATPEPVEPAPETLPQRVKRRTTAATVWAIDASERHLSVALGFRAAEQNRRVAASVLAGGFAYRLFFWLLATGLVTGGALGFVDESSTEEALQKGGIPGAVIDTVGDFARDSSSARWWLLLLGGYLMLWSGYSGSKAAQMVHALIWNEPPRRLARPLAASLAFSGILLALFAIVLGSWWLYDAIGLGAIAALVVFVVPITALWTIVSLRLPHREAGWKELLPGALLVAAGLQVLHAGTLWFVAPKIESSTSLYGPLGAVATLLFWMYLCGRLVVTAPILNVSLYDERRRKQGDPTVPPPVSDELARELAARRPGSGPDA